jgi:hypothetical protein
MRISGLTWALVLGLIARVAIISTVFGWDAVPFTSDDATYVSFAKKLLHYGYVDTHFPLGYTLFLALFLSLSLGKTAFVAIRVVHVLIGLATIVAVQRLTRALYGERAALIAAFLTALYPPLVYMTGRIMSETLFIALLMFSLLALVRADAREDVRLSTLGAALFALGSTVRSNLLLMVPFIPLWLVAKQVGSRSRWLAATAGSIAMLVILVAPGFFHLYTRGEFVPMASNGGQTLYGANNPLAEGGWIEVNNYPELLASIPSEVRLSPRRFDKAQRELALAWIRQNPSTFVRLLPKKFGNAWIPGFQHSELMERSRLASLVLILASGIVTLAALLGRLLVKPGARDGLLLAVLGTYTALSLLIYGNPRIGLFCAPTLIVYSAALGGWLWSRIAPARFQGSM